MTGDRIFGAVMILVALVYIASATTIAVPLFPDPVGPRLVPYMIAGGVILCSVVIIARPDPDADWPGLPALLALSASLAVMIGYSLLLKPFGFLMPTVLAAGLLAYLLAPRPIAAILTGLGLSLGLYILFKHALGLSLKGISDNAGDAMPFAKAFVDWLDGIFAALRDMLANLSRDEGT